MDEDQVNRLILTYLEHNYVNAYSHFAKEAKLSSSPRMPRESRGQAEGGIGSQLGASDARPSAYTEGYAALRDWVQAALDSNKAELHRVLYPVFVSSFIEMGERGYWAEAREFLDEHWEGHDEVHMDDIQSLASIASRQDLQRSALATRLQAHRLKLRMSKSSLDALLSFLQSKGLLVILSIVNCRVQIETSTAPGAEADGASDLERLQALTNSQRVHWELLGTEPYYPRSLQQIRELNDCEEKDVAHSDEEAEQQQEEGDQPRLEAWHLPRLDEQVDDDIMNELKHQVHISPSKLPPICFHTFLNTAQGLNCVHLSRDATTILSGHADSAVRLYRHTDKRRPDVPEEQQGAFREANFPDVAPGQLHTLVGHSGSVYGVCLDPENDFALSCSDDGTVRLWSLEAMRCLVVFKGHGHPVWDVAFAPLGYYFATASHDNTARLWCTEHALPLRIFAGHLSDVDCVQFHPNCNYVATGSTDKSVRLWDVRKGSRARLFVGHSAPITTMCFSPNGRVLASGSSDGEVMLWDLATATCIQALSCKGLGAVHSLDFSANSEMLATGHHEGAVCLWGLDGLRGKLRSRSAEAEPRGDGGDDKAKQGGAGEARLLHTAHTRNTPVFSVTFSHRNLLLASGPFVHPSPPKKQRLW